jgi:uncharacterized protein (TIGR00730 family)
MNHAPGHPPQTDPPASERFPVPPPGSPGPEAPIQTPETAALFDTGSALGAAWGKGARPEEIRFLEGPQSRSSELARVVRIAAEFIRGFRALHFVGPCVTVFGSARFTEAHPSYHLARQTGAHLAEAGFTVMTGGGPGVMEAANRGAKEVGGRSVGCNIELPMEQHENPYLDRFVTFRYFFVRKVMLVKYSYAFIAMPGGFGTLDELFECLTLVQTRKISQFPVVLIGREFWKPLVEFLSSTLVRAGTISPEDTKMFLVTDSPHEAVDHVKSVVLDRFNLTYGPKVKRSWMLREKGLNGGGPPKAPVA